jgi:hypothetical protein
VTSISDTINRHVKYMVDTKMREVSHEIKTRMAVDEARVAIEESLDYVITHLFSAEAIGRGAEKLDGDRKLALLVITASFSALDPSGLREDVSDDLSCHQCAEHIGFTISGFTGFPDRGVCHNCGILDVSGY